MDLVKLHFLPLPVKHNALELLLSPLKVFLNMGQFGAKKYLTDCQTANTIQLIQLIQ